MSVRKAASELQGDLFPLGATAAKAERERGSGRGTHGRPWCALCRLDTLAIGEVYMVKDELWDTAVGPDSFINSSFLCIGCLELRLGRRLMPSDFSDVPLNEIHGGKSPRLRDRMTSEWGVKSKRAHSSSCRADCAQVEKGKSNDR